MTINNFAFNPTDGLRNAVGFPTTPNTEADARNQPQTLLDQLRDYINNTIVTEVNNKLGLSGGTLTGNLTAPALIASGLTGATQASRYVGATTSGPPTTGAFVVGDFVIDQGGFIWICTTTGTPGAWVKPGSTSPITEVYLPMWQNSSQGVSTTSTTPVYLQKGSASTTTTNTSAANKLLNLNSGWPANIKCAFEATIWVGAYTGTYNLYDITASSIVTTLSTSSTAATEIRSSQFTAMPGHSYGISLTSGNGGASAYITDAHLVVFP